MEWLVNNPTCPFCRLDMEGVIWRNERTALLNALEATIQLHDQTHNEGRGARRLRDFILRVTTDEEIPYEPICMTIRFLSREPGLMTNDHLRATVEWWKGKAETELFTEGMLCGFPSLTAALLDDIESHVDESPNDVAASPGRGRGRSLKSWLWRWTRP